MGKTLKEILLSVGAETSLNSLQTDGRSRVTKAFNSGDDDYDDPDELCLKWNAHSGTFTESRSSKRTSLKSFSRPEKSCFERSPEHQKASPSFSDERITGALGDRYPHSIDTAFFTVIDDHRGEPCRPPRPEFYNSPPQSLSLRCDVFIANTGEMSWAHIRPGSPTIEAHKKSSLTENESEELWITFQDVNNLPLIQQQVPIPNVFQAVTGHKGRREILLKITRQRFRYWSQRGDDSNEILICCLSEALKLVIIGGDKKTDVDALKEWLTKEFLINGENQRERVTTGNYQPTEAEMVPSLGQLYSLVGCTPVKYYLKRSVELEPITDILFNFRQMIAKAAHFLLSQQTTPQQVDLLKSAIEIFQYMLGKFIREHSLDWFDYTIKEVSTGKEETKQSTRSGEQTSKSISVFNSKTGRWLEFPSSQFIYQYHGTTFLFTYSEDQSYPIHVNNFRYYKATNFGKRYSFRVQLDETCAFLHFEFSCKFIFKRLMNQFNDWLGTIHCNVPLDESMLPSQLIVGKLIGGKGPVFGTTKRCLHDADTLKMISDDCSKMARQIVDAVAIRLVVDNIDDECLIAEYKKLKASFIGPKKITKLTAQDLQWRYGRFDSPN